MWSSTPSAFVEVPGAVGRPVDADAGLPVSAEIARHRDVVGSAERSRDVDREVVAKIDEPVAVAVHDQVRKRVPVHVSQQADVARKAIGHDPVRYTVPVVVVDEEPRDARPVERELRVQPSLCGGAQRRQRHRD
jgi:hypothetical protein